MKKYLLLSCTALTALSLSAAAHAEFYAGAAAGYQWGTDEVTEFTDAGAFSQSLPDIDPDGIVGGLFGGYNHHVTPMVVLGLEADIEGSNADDAFTLGGPDTLTTELNWQGSVRARAGVNPVPEALLYVTGGVAFVDLDHSYVNNGGAPETFSETETGWTAGVGGEYAFASNVFGRFEYRYTDLGTSNDNSAVAFATLNYDHDITSHAVRVGVGMRF